MSDTPATDRDLDRVLRHLELTVTRRLDGLLRGTFASAATGPGTDPDSAREYVIGDDVRLMDWSVTARTGVAHVRDPEAERELESWIVAESSPRLTTGSGPTTKRHLLAAATAAVALLADNPGDRTALVADGTLIPPGQGRAHAMRLIARAARHVGGSGLAADLGTLPSRAPRAGLVTVISDFLGPVDWADALRVVGTRTDVLAIRLIDPADESLPGAGPVRLSDPTTGEILDVDIDDATRRRYETAAREHSERVTAALRSARARIVELRTDRDWVLDFARQVAPGRGGAR
ncbi:DUF58 domain-containing protein [Corynebacterium freneyi]|uniref:DUF58 domain-containing protein n=1 Tax=Corynebacterium freneyi TaxID=134034 RepID=UPI001EF21C67|nr:DUF58 domain-containing protein [Corynebacterium freneyi]MCG7437974.1 DUF58 domain-containing protein [Corynebacterium freneyi]